MEVATVRYTEATGGSVNFRTARGFVLSVTSLAPLEQGWYTIQTATPP